MNRTSAVYTMLTIAVIFAIVIPFNFKAVKADGDYSIDHVDHSIKIMYNGYVLVNDTIQLSGELPNSFLFGYPYKFGSYLVSCFAFEVDNLNNVFPVSIDEPLEDRSGFYGLKVDLSNGPPQNFTVQLLFSNGLVVQNTQNSSLFTLAFPAFPSFLKTAGSCNSSIALHKDAQLIGGTLSNLTYQEYNLAPFTYNSSTVSFYMASDEVQVFDVDHLVREVTASEFGDIAGSDSFYITNKGSFAINFVKVMLPSNASSVSAEDQFGRNMNKPTAMPDNANRYVVNLTMSLEPGKSTRFSVDYSLSREAYIERREGSNRYELGMTLFQDLDCYINETRVTFVLPEGAQLQTFEDTLTGSSFGMVENVFQDRATINKHGMMALESFNVGMVYEYNSLWVSFRPTTWVMVLAIVGCIAAAVLRRAKAPTPVSVPAGVLRLRPDYIRTFVDSYEEKMKAIAEIDSLESKAQKGKIPRRRYKVQRKMLETRVDTLSRNLSEYRDRMRAAGAHYTNLARELEIAETQMNEAQANIKSVEARYGRGEISIEAYRKLLDDYQRRKEKTETTINGILLRLREEIR